MTRTRTDYELANRPLQAVLDAVDPTRWSADTPCEGWSARDVVAHLIGAQREFLTGHGADLGQEPDLDDDPAQAWRTHATHVMAALADDAVAGAAFDGYFGPTTVGDTLARFYVWDMVVHRWDVARATGGDASLTDDELDRVENGADGFGDALYSDGVCAPGVEAPPGSDRTQRVLARLGRTP